MRIVCLVTQLESGGAQRVALDLAETLRGRGHVVETWFLYQKSPAYAGASSVRVISSERPRTARSLVALLVALYAELRRFRPDATVSFTHYANVLGSIVAMLARVPLRIASQQNPGWSYPRGARWLDRLAGSTGLYTANVAASRAVQDSFAGYPAPYRQRLVVVPNGTTVQRTTATRTETRSRFGIDADAFLVLAVGRLHPQKNHSILIRSLAAAPRIRLALAGDGELRGELETLAVSMGVRERVTFLGAIDGDDVRPLMAAADAFAMPSRFEGLSLALIEAMATPLPIVSSDVPPQQEVLIPRNQEPCGLLLGCDDHDAWSSAFRQLAIDEQLRRRLAQAAARRASDFTLDATARGYEAAIKC